MKLEMNTNRIALCAACAVLLCGMSAAQVTLLDEDFATGTGNMPPAGWTAVTNIGTIGTEEWRFDNPEPRPVPAAMTSPFAIWDDDNLSGPGGMSDGELISPTFNASASASVILRFETEHYTLGNTIEVDVFDGTTWNNVLSTTASIPAGNTLNAGNSETQMLDVTAAAGGSPNARVRFHWINGTWDWYWLVDDVKVFEPAMGTGQAATPGFAALDVNNAALDPGGLPVLAGNKGPHAIALSVSAGDTIGLKISGEPMQPSICFIGRTLANGVPIPGFGTVDLDPANALLPIFIFGNAFAAPPSFFDLLFNSDAAGDINLTLPINAQLMAISPFGFSAINLTPTNTTPITITNTVDVTINP